MSVFNKIKQSIPRPAKKNERCIDCLHCSYDWTYQCNSPLIPPHPVYGYQQDIPCKEVREEFMHYCHYTPGGYE